MASKYIYKIGRRKTSVATLRLFSGKGQSLINGEPVNELYPNKLDQQRLFSPFSILELGSDKYYFTAKVSGGGVQSQLGALTLALSRALVGDEQEFRVPLKKNGLLTRDPRMVERKKTGLHKSRKREQYSKR